MKRPMIPEDRFFSEAKKTKKNCCKLNEEDDLLNGERDFFKKYSESDNEVCEARTPEDVVTVQDFIDVLNHQCGKTSNEIMFLANHKKLALFDIYSKGGITVVDFVSAKSIMHEEDLDEGRGWYGGGYGGTGHSYSGLDGKAPIGKEIGWFSVGDLDPKAKGKMPGWRCGPSNFPFEDLLYPQRKYKVGTMVMRNKYVQAGSMSGQYYIAIPSYFDAINNNDQAALKLLDQLGIPRDLTFQMNPKDDYTMTYVVKSK